MDTFLQELQREVRLIPRQGLTDRLDEDRVVTRDTEAVGLQQVTLDLEVKSGCECTQEVVSGCPEVGVARSEVKERHVEEGPRHVLGPDLLMHCDTVGLAKLPPRPDVDN